MIHARRLLVQAIAVASMSVIAMLTPKTSEAALMGCSAGYVCVFSCADASEEMCSTCGFGIGTVCEYRPDMCYPPDHGIFEFAVYCGFAT